MTDTRAYMIILAQISGRDAFMKGYSKAAAELVAKHGGRYLMLAPGSTLLEGNWGEGAAVAISEWPNRVAIAAFWESPEYAEVKKLREGISDVKVLVVDAPKISPQ